MNIFKKDIIDLKINEIEDANENYIKFYFDTNNNMERLYYKRKRISENSIFYYHTNDKNIKECEGYLYSINGQKRLECYYVNNKLHGNYITYYMNGNKRSVQKFDNGEVIDNAYTYDVDNKFMHIHLPINGDFDPDLYIHIDPNVKNVIEKAKYKKNRKIDFMI